MLTCNSLQNVRRSLVLRLCHVAFGRGWPMCSIRVVTRGTLTRDPVGSIYVSFDLRVFSVFFIIESDRTWCQDVDVRVLFSFRLAVRQSEGSDVEEEEHRRFHVCLGLLFDLGSALLKSRVGEELVCARKKKLDEADPGRLIKGMASRAWRTRSGRRPLVFSVRWIFMSSARD